MNKIQITDLGLFNSLITRGCELDKDTPYMKLLTENGTTLNFYFAPSDRVTKLIEAWNHPELYPNFLDAIAGLDDYSNLEDLYLCHTMAISRIDNMNRIGSTKEIKDSAGLIQIKKNGKTLLVSTNATEEQKAKLISRL